MNFENIPLHELYKIAQDINTSADVLHELALMDDIDILIDVAYHPNISAKTLKLLSLHNCSEIRVAIADNPNCPIDVLLNILSKDTNPSVLNVSTQTLTKLFKNCSIELLRQLAENTNSTPVILNALYNYEKSSDIPGLRIFLAEHHNTPTGLLYKLSKDEDMNVRAAVAANRNSPLKLLVDLSQDKEYYVRAAVAMNPNIQEDILNQLADDENDWVKSIILVHKFLDAYSENKMEYEV